MKDTFDSIFKLLVLVMLGYFLFLVNKTSGNKETNEIGRYQFHSTDNFVLDTKTGTVYKPYIGKLPTE